MNLRNQTTKALKEGYFPIVLGGDHSQAIGSIAGMKRFMPDTKIIWVDAHIDANTPETSPSRNAHGMPLAFLSGQVPMHKNWECVNIQKDLCYFGIRSYEDEEAKLISDNNVLVFEPKDCDVNDMSKIRDTMDKYFYRYRGHSDKSKYWISFDIDSLDASAFRSTGTAEGGGLSLEFLMKLFQAYVPKSIGMDLSEVNFELTSGQVR
jgi:arginase